MAYSRGALQALEGLIDANVPIGGRILDIGSQDIAAATHDDIRSFLFKLHGDHVDAVLSARFREGERWKVADMFEDSLYRHESIDLYPGKSIIQADLNTFAVPPEYHGAFDLLANLGSTEHVFDQANVFRCMHDLVKVGGVFWHCVPTIGYYNHSLYNYHPLFFVFLARANKYKIESATLSPPHLEHTIPKSILAGIEFWTDIRLFSAMLSFVVRKTVDAPFQLFTDYDQAVMGEQQQQDDWSEMIKTRYDLRVHD